MKAHLQFGGAALGRPSGPFETIPVECRETERPRSGQTQSGYGNRIPTSYMVKWLNKWRRVYVAQFGNAGTAYIGKPGAWLAIVDDIERESAR